MKLRFSASSIDFPALAETDAEPSPMQLSYELVQELKSLEEMLLRPEVRRSREQMDAVLAADFVEYGSSGRIYDKAAILETAGKSFDGQLSLEGFSAKTLAPTVALVNYRSVLRRADGSESRTNRSSVWLHTGKDWKLVFHQGTPANPVQS